MSEQKTILLNLKLFEPNVDEFPQFNYKTLYLLEKEKQKVDTTQTNGIADPSKDSDQDEYSEAYTGNGKNSFYDENDGFVDDSEAFDELVPDEMDTDRGGFYVNFGQLQYKKLMNFEGPEDEKKMAKLLKRSFSSRSSDSNDNKKSSTPKNRHVKKKAKLLKNKAKSQSSNGKKPELGKFKDDCVTDSVRDTSEKEEKTTSVRKMRVKRVRQKNSVDWLPLQLKTHHQRLTKLEK